MDEFKVGKVPRHYKFRLVTRRDSGIPNRRKVFWARGPQEALDQASEVLGIWHISPQTFEKSGGVSLRKITAGFLKGEGRERSQQVYPF